MFVKCLSYALADVFFNEIVLKEFLLHGYWPALLPIC